MAGEKWTCEHIVALCNGGKNIEANLGLSCSNCLPDKNAEDVAEKADVYRVRAKHLGIHQPKRVFPGSRRDKLKKHVDGRTSQR